MGSSEMTTMLSASVLVASVLVVGLCVPSAVVFARPQELKCPNGDPFYPNAGTVDENGCTVGYCSKVCPTGAITNDCRHLIEAASGIHQMGRETSSWKKMKFVEQNIIL